MKRCPHPTESVKVLEWHQESVIRLECACGQGWSGLADDWRSTRGIPHRRPKWVKRMVAEVRARGMDAVNAGKVEKKESLMKCPKCGLEHTVRECKPEGGHTDRKRYLICPMADGGCGHHWGMGMAQAIVLDQMAKLEGTASVGERRDGGGTKPEP